MAMSLKAASMIQGNEVACHSTGPYDNGKYGFTVWLLKANVYHAPVISLEHGIYDTPSAGVQAAEALVGAVKELDLSGPKENAMASIKIVFGKTNRLLKDGVVVEYEEKENVVHE